MTSTPQRCLRQRHWAWFMPRPGWLLTPSAGLVVVLVALSATAAAQEGRGFAEVRLSLSPGATGKLWQTVERVRPTLETDLSKRLKLVATIEGDLSEGRSIDQELQRTLKHSAIAPALDLAGCSWPQPANTIFRINSAADYLDVDRLYLDLYNRYFDLRVGRQAIHWGSAQIINPTDPFPEVLFTQPWRPRRGVNAARIIVPFGALDDFTAVAGVDDTLLHPNAAARLRLNWGSTDFAVVGAYRGVTSQGLAGLDVRGTLVVEWWIEAALHLDGSPTEEIAAGADYTFNVLQRLMVFAQYYRNGAGATNPNNYKRFASLGQVALPSCTNPTVSALFASATTSDPFAPFTSARDYVFLGVTAQITEDVASSLTVLQNLDDGTAVIVPTVNWDITGWLEVAAVGQIPAKVWGPGGEFYPRKRDLTLSTPLGSADLSGLVPDAVITLYSRINF